MRVAVIGTGVMGAGMAGALASAGHEVVVWNRTGSKASRVAESVGAEAAGSVTEAVGGADAVITILFDTDSVLAVADELAAALGADAVWLQCSTIGPEGTRRVVGAAGEAAARLLDAPVLGTKKPAADGALVVLVGGPADAVDRARPVLEAIGSRTIVVGDEHGAGSALKLACNSWVALLTAGTAQALALAEVQGVDPQLFLDAIKGGAVDTPYAHVKGAAMLAREFDDVSFELDGVRKDYGLMVEAADAAGMPDDLLRAVLGVFDRASESGHGDEDMGAVRTAFDA